MGKQMALADAEAERMARMAEIEREKHGKAELVEANMFLLRKRAEERHMQEMEEARMLDYAKQKESDLLERRDREELRFRERQAQRQKMIDAQVAKLTDLNAAQNMRLEKQAQEVQAKAMEARAKMDEQKQNELLAMHSRLSSVGGES